MKPSVGEKLKPTTSWNWSATTTRGAPAENCTTAGPGAGRTIFSGSRSAGSAGTSPGGAEKQPKKAGKPQGSKTPRAGPGLNRLTTVSARSTPSVENAKSRVT